ncbi:MAG: hypothetical protein AAF206_11405 [Bacteroidota bacterium]
MKNISRPLLFLLLLHSLFLSKSLAQSNLLDRQITFEASKISLKQALYRLSELGEFGISYNPRIFPLDKQLDLSLEQKSIHQSLDELLGEGKYNYIVIEDHLIINRANLPKRAEEKALPLPKPVVRRDRIIRGQLLDLATGKPLYRASVFDRRTGKAAVTNRRGYYQLNLPTDQQKGELVLQHRLYEAKELVVSFKRDTIVNQSLQPVTITPIEAQEIVLQDSIDNPVADVFLVRLLINDQILSSDLKDTLYRKFAQITVIPPASSNGLLTPKTVNTFSLNVIAGYSAGLDGLEFGTLLNAERYDVNGVQIAGLANVVGGRANGVQFAGGFNVNFRSVGGFQLAGFGNWADSLKYGAQISGFTNVLTGQLKGAQITGFFNVSAGNIEGVQIAGFGNLSTGISRGLQISGFINTSGVIAGSQLTGGINIARTVIGTQLAPILNLSYQSVLGTQIGLINVAGKVKGAQFGLINFADSINGVPFGLLSFVRQGYHPIELTGDEILNGQLIIRTGTRRFYNILRAGIDPGPEGDAVRWGFGYGIGTQTPLGRKRRWHWAWEASANQIIPDSREPLDVNLMGQLHTGLVISLNRHLDLHLGPNANLFLTTQKDPISGEFTANIPPYILAERNINDNALLQFWVGGRVGISFR